MRLRRAVLTVILATYACMARGYDLHVGDVTIALQNSCSTDHKLNVKVGNDILCAAMTNDTVTEKSLRVNLNGTVYTVCNNGTCDSGGEWVMPETPYAPIVIPNCTWEQTNSKAYLLSDGNQYFDTGTSLNPENNVEVTLQVINGQSARIFGSMGSSCTYDMTIRNDGVFAIRMGSGAVTKKLELDEAVRVAKNVIKTETSNKTKNYKNIYVNDTKVISNSTASRCTSTYDFLILKNNFISVDNSANGGIKLYRIRLWDADNNLLHDYQPVAAGTNICGVTPPTNAIWDFVTKKLYYPAGTGQMGYGVDP